MKNNTFFHTPDNSSISLRDRVVQIAKVTHETKIKCIDPAIRDIIQKRYPNHNISESSIAKVISVKTEIAENDFHSLKYAIVFANDINEIVTYQKYTKESDSFETAMAHGSKIKCDQIRRKWWINRPYLQALLRELLAVWTDSDDNTHYVLGELLEIQNAIAVKKRVQKEIREEYDLNESEIDPM